MPGFHEVLFPLSIGFGSTGGPERRTDIVLLASGHEERNSRWADSRRRYDAGTGVHSLADLHTLVAFFEERRGRLYGFRWRDRADFKSCAPDATPEPMDQAIGTGDGANASFQLVKKYGGAFDPYARTIAKPVAGTVRIAVDSVEQSEGADFTVDTDTGVVTFEPGAIPGAGAEVTAGFEFNVPVRFDTDRLSVNLASFEAGKAVQVPIVEIKV
ncbi:MAG: phage distal tail protein, Rcc01695 family [Propylenella sp.]